MEEKEQELVFVSGSNPENNLINGVGLEDDSEFVDFILSDDDKKIFGNLYLNNLFARFANML